MSDHNANEALGLALQPEFLRRRAAGEDIKRATLGAMEALGQERITAIITSAFTVEPHEDTHAVHLHDCGAVFVLYAADSSLPAAEQYRVCENVRARILRVARAQGRTAP